MDRELHRATAIIREVLQPTLPLHQKRCSRLNKKQVLHLSADEEISPNIILQFVIRNIHNTNSTNTVFYLLFQEIAAYDFYAFELLFSFCASQWCELVVLVFTKEHMKQWM